MPESKSTSQADIIRIMEICRDIELSCAGLYHYYAEIFNDTPAVADMWKKTAHEEENHSYQFVLAINLRNKGVIEHVSIDQFHAESTLKRVTLLNETVRRDKPGLADALRTAIELEEKLAEFHAEAMASFTDESFRNMFSAMMKADNYHLGEFLTAYGSVSRGDILL
jgi:rubrerythrin